MPRSRAGQPSVARTQAPPDERRLARAVGPDERGDRAREQLERHVLERERPTTPVAFGEGEGGEGGPLVAGHGLAPEIHAAKRRAAVGDADVGHPQSPVRTSPCPATRHTALPSMGEWAAPRTDLGGHRGDPARRGMGRLGGPARDLAGTPERAVVGFSHRGDGVRRRTDDARATGSRRPAVAACRRGHRPSLDRGLGPWGVDAGGGHRPRGLVARRTTRRCGGFRAAAPTGHLAARVRTARHRRRGSGTRSRRRDHRARRRRTWLIVLVACIEAPAIAVGVASRRLGQSAWGRPRPTCSPGLPSSPRASRRRWRAQCWCRLMVRGSSSLAWLVGLGIAARLAVILARLADRSSAGTGSRGRSRRV
jgi:hypothetical protein